MTRAAWPAWVVLHLPHDATFIPPEVRGQFLPDDAALAGEVLRMTDHHTHALFVPDEGGPAVVRALDAPHQARLEAAVDEALATHGRCLVLDCHSFPSVPLPYEKGPIGFRRPDVCIGTDAFHTPPALAAAFVGAFDRAGWRVAVNHPFAGALVPAKHLGRDARVQALMVEVNRARYMGEESGARRSDFAAVAAGVRAVCLSALSGCAATRGSAPMRPPEAAPASRVR